MTLGMQSILVILSKEDTYTYNMAPSSSANIYNA